MVLLLFGPPGCGKGTQSPLLRDKLGLPAISTGEMLRAECARHSATGEWIDQLLAAGQLVPDDVVNTLLEARLSEPDCQNGFLIDGYPRTVEQASHLTHTLEQLGFAPPTLIHMDVPAEVLVERLSARWGCPGCGAIFNVLSRPPLRTGHCDHCATPLTQRSDDTAATARLRLEAYARLTNPVLEYYELPGTGRVVHINAHQPPDEVFAEIRQALETEVFSPVRRRIN